MFYFLAMTSQSFQAAQRDQANVTIKGLSHTFNLQFSITIFELSLREIHIFDTFKGSIQKKVDFFHMEGGGVRAKSTLL